MISSRYFFSSCFCINSQNKVINSEREEYLMSLHPTQRSNARTKIWIHLESTNRKKKITTSFEVITRPLAYLVSSSGDMSRKFQPCDTWLKYNYYELCYTHWSSCVKCYFSISLIKISNYVCQWGLVCDHSITIDFVIGWDRIFRDAKVSIVF